MEKIRFQSPDGTVEDFYIEEQTRIGGVAYLLVSDSMDDEANAYIKSGDMVGTALQQIALITEMAVEQADAYLNGTAPEEEKQLVPCVAITADNTDCLNAFVYTEPDAK